MAGTAPTLHAEAAVSMVGRGLRNCAHWLARAEVHVLQQGEDPALLGQARLAPDMLPLSAQVAMACNGAVQRLAILAGTGRPPIEAEEAALPAMRDMCLRGAAFIETLAGQAWQQQDDHRHLTVDFPPGFPTKVVRADTFLQQAVLPNFYFHLCMGYALLRQHGVAIGKLDFLYGDQATGAPAALSPVPAATLAAPRPPPT